MNFDLINPSTRSLYTSALTPPEGFSFDSAVVTSFSAQLDFLLEAPVHMALTSANSSEIKRDPLRIMDSVRRYSDRITVFYQRGRMLQLIVTRLRLLKLILLLIMAVVHVQSWLFRGIL